MGVNLDGECLEAIMNLQGNEAQGNMPPPSRTTTTSSGGGSSGGGVRYEM